MKKRSNIIFAIAVSMPFVIFIGCAGIRKTGSASIFPTNFSNPVPVVPAIAKKVKADTPSKNDIKNYIREQYRFNYEKFVTPDIKKMYGALQDVAISNQRLTLYLSILRSKADSIARERNYYRLISDNKDTAYQNKVISLQKQLIALQNRQQAIQERAEVEYKKQIRLNTILTVCCLIGVIMLTFALLILYYRVNKLYKNFVKYA